MTKLKAAANALGQARADLDSLRDRIAELAAERKRIESAPCDRAEAERRIDQLVERERATGILKPLALRLAGRDERGAASLYVSASLREDPLAVLAAVMPDGLKAALLAEIPPGGMAEVDRVAELARLDREIEAAEVAEEVACREIEAATGGTVPRRQDANPAVLLAPDNELEGIDAD